MGPSIVERRPSTLRRTQKSRRLSPAEVREESHPTGGRVRRFCQFFDIPFCPLLAFALIAAPFRKNPVILYEDENEAKLLLRTFKSNTYSVKYMMGREEGREGGVLYLLFTHEALHSTSFSILCKNGQQNRIVRGFPLLQNGN